MSSNILLTIDVFDPEESLVALLDSGGFKFMYRDKNPAVKIANDRTLDVVGAAGDSSQVYALSSLLVEWLAASAYRKIQVQMKDCSIVYLEAYSVEEVAKILPNAIKVTAFDPEYNNMISGGSS